MKSRIKISALLISALFIFYSCQEEQPKKEKKRFVIKKESETGNQVESKSIVEKRDSTLHEISPEQFEKHGMILATAATNSINQTISAAGYISAPKENIAEVRSYIGGYLRSSPLLPGDYVEKGQFLISLENLEYIELQQTYLQVKEELKYLKTVYDRQRVLANEKITSLNSKQQAESEYNSMLANYEGLRKKLKLISIDPDKLSPDNIASSINLYAPSKGYITLVNAVRGMFVEPTDVIFEIVNTNHLHIELRVYEKDILKVRKGQQLTFRIPEANSENYMGEVFLVGRTIEASDRTVSVHCHIHENSKIPALVGMYAEAEIIFDASDGLCLPLDAFLREDGDYFVFVLNTKTEDVIGLDKIRVDVGKINEECIEIAGASKQVLEGKQILIQGAYDM